jgi:hypothetical protein
LGFILLYFPGFPVFSKNQRELPLWCWAFLKTLVTVIYGPVALSRSPPKSEEYTVDGACCLTKITPRAFMSSTALPCPAFSKRDQADETKHYATTKDTHLCSMRETCARLPCKNEKYACALNMQSDGLILHSQFGTEEAHGASGSLDLPAGTNVCRASHIKACCRRGRLLFLFPTIPPPSPKHRATCGMVSASPKIPNVSNIFVFARFFPAPSMQKKIEKCLVDVGLSMTYSNSYRIDGENTSLADIQKQEKKGSCRWSE